MSLNKGKAKVKSKSKSVAKSAGKSKAAVMNSRNPKKPMAISGDTMSNYAMYKKGGKVKKSLVKAQKGISKARVKYERNKQGFIEGTNGGLGIESAGMNTAQELSNTAGFALGSLVTGDTEPAKKYIKRKLGMKKKGGKVKKSLPKAQAGIPPMARSMSSLDRAKLQQATRNKELEQQWSEERNKRALEQARREYDLKNPNSSSYGPMKQTGYKVPVSSRSSHESIHDSQPFMKQAGGKTPGRRKILKKVFNVIKDSINKSTVGGKNEVYKKGGATKAKKFAALAPPYNKITTADRIAGAKKNARKK